jgi:cellulose synthase/poly-beta-1,6-N-acetylglucosamine synthase-like glycosyltransferase
LIFSQDYPDFEVVVVNDCSYDNTGDVLEEFAKRHSNLKIVTIKEDEYYQHGKKVAVMMGIKGAKHEWLVFTDADCAPASDQWLKKMASHFTGSTEIVLGYGPFRRTGGFLNKLIRFDAFQIGLNYLSFARAGNAYMGVGRNMAYKKSLFYRIKGFASHYHLRSGDDDLFVNEAANGRNVAVEYAPESFCYTDPKKSMKEWWFQKKRHLETGKRYHFRHKMQLFTHAVDEWIFFGGAIAAFILMFQPYIVGGVLIFRLLMQMLIFNSAMKKLGERDLLILAPVAELMLMFFYPVITVSRIFQRKRKWN